MRRTIAWCEKNGAGGSRSTPYASSRGRLVSSVSRYSNVVMTTTISSSGTPVKRSRRTSAKFGHLAQRLCGHRFDDGGARPGTAENRSNDDAACIVRKAADVFDEPGELAVPVQVRLDIRHVERRHAAAASRDRVTNRLHRVCARDVA